MIKRAKFLVIAMFVAGFSMRVRASSEVSTDIGIIPDGSALSKITISPDSQHVAIVVKTDAGNSMTLDGKTIFQASGNFAAPQFSPDSKRLAFIDIEARAACVVVDGKKQTSFDEIADNSLLWSHSSNQFAYFARRDKEWFFVLGTSEMHAGDLRPGPSALSDDGSHYAFTSKHEGSVALVRDGKEGEVFQDIGELVMSSNGEHLAYSALVAPGKWIVMSDVSRSESYEYAESLQFSKDGRRIAFIAGLAHDSQHVPAESTLDEVAVVDGISSKHFHEITNGPVFSDDGKRVAFQGSVPRGIVNRAMDYTAELWVDGKQVEMLNSISRIAEMQFTPDGNHLGGLSNVEDGPMSMQPFARFFDAEVDWLTMSRNAGGMAFSPDSKHFAFLSQHDNDLTQNAFLWAAYVDDQAGKYHSKVAKVIFSPESKHFAYAALDNGRWIVVLDGKEIPSLELLRGTTDGGLSAKWESIGELEEEPPPIPRAQPQNFLKAVMPYAFDADGNLSFIGFRDSHLYRVVVAP